MSLCCPRVDPIKDEYLLAYNRLRSCPINIWWYRRRTNDATNPCSGGCGESINENQDRSPFPRSWSINFSGKSKLGTSVSEESSVCSTASQERRLKRDDEGNCRKHPHIQLARRKINTGPSRFTKLFSNSIGVNNDRNSRREEWDTIHDMCPECERQRRESKARYHYKPENVPTHPAAECQQSGTHVPFPATITAIKSHPRFEMGTMALIIRTDAIPTDQTLRLSYPAATGTSNANDEWGGVQQWETPDGALDCMYPADSNGNILSTLDKTSSHRIMERIIPMRMIDHISRGGDAWDILRQSTGEQDRGCACDVKIHGFSDRLLRFDVVKFDAMQDEATHAGSYTAETVIATLNSILLGDRESRKATTMSGLFSSISTWFEEVMSLGATKFGDPRSSLNQSGGRFS